MSLWGFLFGILLEWIGLKKLIKKRFSINWILLILTVIVSIFVFIPNVYWVEWYGTPVKGTLRYFYVNALEIPETHMVLSIVSGAMLVRSFTDNN